MLWEEAAEAVEATTVHIIPAVIHITPAARILIRAADIRIIQADRIIQAAVLVAAVAAALYSRSF